MNPLPTGTITFLFTDIQGSTRLWENYPDTMGTAVARHDALLRLAVEANNGCLFKTTGDGITAAFTNAPDALAAALAAQTALLVEPWPEPIALSARMGLHTGSAELRDGDYFGSTPNRCARLMAAGHGGQALLSDLTQELCRDVLPPLVSLVLLGQCRLKDLTRPETVYQLRHPSLPESFPPLRTLDNPELPNNLPQQLTSFVGREAAIAEVQSLLKKARLLTLTGSGGIGKTRLSLQVAADLLEEYLDGVWQAELAALSEPALVPQTVASALGIREQAGQTMAQTMVESLKSKRLLLLLDNAEHLLAACSSLVAALLRSCPHVKVLVTSREPLGISGELTYRIPSLSLPDPRQVQNSTADTLRHFEAVRLFMDRAVFARPAFAVTNSNAPSLAELCFRLDGIPLAIELAAARVRSLTVAQINDKLDSRFRFLTGGDRAALPRQQTLRALVDWSYDLLTEAEKTLLARLSVFVGGWTLAAAESVCCFNPVDDLEILDLLVSLIDKSLVLAQEEGAGANRYRMLETLRQYAMEKAEISGETQMVNARHLNYFVRLAEEAEPELAGSDQVTWLNRLETEHDNLRGALAYCAGGPAEEPTADRLAAGLRLGGALWRFWYVRGYLSEGREHLSSALRQTVDQVRSNAADSEQPEAELTARAKALLGAGTLAWRQSDYAAARSLFEESLGLRRKLGNKSGIANSLLGLGNIAANQGDYAAARSLHEESVTLFRELGDKSGTANSLISLGNGAFEQGDYASARTLYEESLALRREIDDKSGIANSLISLGNVVFEQGDFPSARAHYEENLDLRRALGNKGGIANSLVSLGNVAFEQGDYVSASALHEESLALFQELGEKGGIAYAFLNLGNVALGQKDHAVARSRYAESLARGREVGDKRVIAYGLEGFAFASPGASHVDRAITILATANALRRAIGVPSPPSDQVKLDGQIAQARAALGDAAFAEAWAQGFALSSEAAIALALAEVDAA